MLSLQRWKIETRESFELSKREPKGSNRMVDILLLCEYRSRYNTMLCLESCGNTVIRKNLPEKTVLTTEIIALALTRGFRLLWKKKESHIVP